MISMMNGVYGYWGTQRDLEYAPMVERAYDYLASLVLAASSIQGITSLHRKIISYRVTFCRTYS